MLRDGAASGYANAAHGIVSGNYAKPMPMRVHQRGAAQLTPLRGPPCPSPLGSKRQPETPHCSSTASLETIGTAVAEDVRRLRANAPLLNRVDYARGY